MQPFGVAASNVDYKGQHSGLSFGHNIEGEFHEW